MIDSATAYCDDDFKLVICRQLLSYKCAARHDLSVALQCDAFASKSHHFDKGGDSCFRGELAEFAIDTDGDHFAYIAHDRICAAFYYKRV